jgi:hypothetical protein
MGSRSHHSSSKLAECSKHEISILLFEGKLRVWIFDRSYSPVILFYRKRQQSHNDLQQKRVNLKSIKKILKSKIGGRY